MSVSYKKAGVDIDRGNFFVEGIAQAVKQSWRRGVVGSIGGFGAFFDLQKARSKSSLLVSSCDGVGTKLKIAGLAGIHNTVGVDLVAMSVNDVLCSGAEPLFFLDYIATGKIEAPVLKEVMDGIIRGCRLAGCALIGGETAEMPGMYKKGDYDLAGFCVGVVDGRKVLGSHRVKIGDAVIGLESSGLHSNGFSLVRKIVSPVELKARALEFLEPTRIYVAPVLEVLRKFNSKNIAVKAVAHITGGAFYDKAGRLVPQGSSLVLYKNAWVRPKIFEELQERGRIPEKDMYRTFNMGVGMILVVDNRVKMEVVRALNKQGVQSSVIGEMVKGAGAVTLV